MKTDLERDDFLTLLEKLRSKENNEILKAVRDINAKMTVAGVSWDDLLISQGADKVDDDDKDSDSENEKQKNGLFTILFWAVFHRQKVGELERLSGPCQWRRSGW